MYMKKYMMCVYARVWLCMCFHFATVIYTSLRLYTFSVFIKPVNNLYCYIHKKEEKEMRGISRYLVRIGCTLLLECHSHVL